MNTASLSASIIIILSTRFSAINFTFLFAFSSSAIEIYDLIIEVLVLTNIGPTQLFEICGLGVRRSSFVPDPLQVVQQRRGSQRRSREPFEAQGVTQ